MKDRKTLENFLYKNLYSIFCAYFITTIFVRISNEILCYGGRRKNCLKPNFHLCNEQ